MQLELIEQESKKIENINFNVTNQQEYEKLAYMKIQTTNLKKKIKEFFAPMVKKAHEAHKAIKEQENKYIKNVEDCEQKIILSLKIYERTQQEIKEKAEQERIRLEKEKEEAEKDLFKDDTTLETIKKTEQKLQSIEQTDFQKIAGIGLRKNWKFRIVDKAKIPRGYLIPDEVLIGKEVRTLKENCKIEGIEVYCE